MTRHPHRNERPCQQCGERPADRYLFTVLIRTGGHDATKTTSCLCAACAAEGVRWIERFGFTAADAIGTGDWDALVQMLPE